MERREAAILIEDILDCLIEYGNTNKDEELIQKAREKMFEFRDEWFDANTE